MDPLSCPAEPQGEHKSSSRLGQASISSERPLHGQSGVPATQDLAHGSEKHSSWPVDQGAVPELLVDMSPAAEGQWPCSVTDALHRFFSDKVWLQPSILRRTQPLCLKYACLIAPYMLKRGQS